MLTDIQMEKISILVETGEETIPCDLELRHLGQAIRKEHCKMLAQNICKLDLLESDMAACYIQSPRVRYRECSATTTLEGLRGRECMYSRLQLYVYPVNEDMEPEILITADCMGNTYWESAVYVKCNELVKRDATYCEYVAAHIFTKVTEHLKLTYEPDRIKALEVYKSYLKDRAAILEAERVKAVQKAIEGLRAFTYTPDRFEFIRQYNECMRQLDAYKLEVTKLEHKVKELNTFVGTLQPITGAPIAEAIQKGFEAGNIEDVRMETSGIIYITYRGFIGYWEEDEIESYIKAMQRNYSAEKAEDVALVLRHMLIDKDVQRAYKQTVILNLTDFYASRNGYNGDTIEHPHIGRYNCFGDNEETIKAMLKTGDYDVALAVLSNTLNQINLTDYCVGSSMLEDDYSYDRRPWYYNGEYYTINKLVSILKGGDTNETNQIQSESDRGIDF